MTRISWRRLLATVVASANVASCSRGSPEANVAARPGQETPERISIRWTPDSSDTNKMAVEVCGLSAAVLEELRLSSNWGASQWQSLLAVYVVQGDLRSELGLPPIAGVYRVDSGKMRFEPQFPIEPGVEYRAFFWPNKLPRPSGPENQAVSSSFHAPLSPVNPSTVVTQIYPGSDVVPENLLKFYIHFSAPMSRGGIYDHIRLLDEKENKTELPFLEIDEELWDPTMRRITLFIDPGRIKRGVRPLEEVGPALEAGKAYTLVIDREWSDATGTALKESFRKSFRVGPSDRAPPDPADWKIHPAKSSTRDPLTILFPEPMDHALAQRLIWVTGLSGEPMNGMTKLDDQERRWTFTPASAWRAGLYQVVIQTTLEDLAGNNIGKPFEVDLLEGVQRRLSKSTVSLPFEVR